MHLISLRQVLKASEMLTRTDAHVLHKLVQENSSGEGITNCACALMVHIATMIVWYAVVDNLEQRRLKSL